MNALRLLLLGIAVVGCTAEPGPMEPPSREAAATASSRLVPVRKPDDRSILEAPAVVRAASTAFGEVTPPATLRVARVHVQVGHTVAKGEPIIDAYAPEVLDAAAAYLSTASRVRMHERRADELEALLGEGLVRRAEVFEQRAKASELRASRLRALAVLRSSGVDPDAAAALLEDGVVTLTAPVAGVVVELNARVGRSYQPGTEPIARILGEAPARIEVRTAKPWPSASAVTFLTADGREIALDPVPIASVVVPVDGTIRSWFRPKERSTFPEGLVGTARVSASEDLWEVPAAAIRRTGQVTELALRRGDATEVVSVEVATASGASALVSGPLEAGDRVVSEFPTAPDPVGAQ